MALRFDTDIAIVLEHVLLLHFECSQALLCETLLVLELFVLSLQEFISLCCFCKFTVDKLILPGKSLDILGQLSSFSRLDLDDLGLVLDLIPHVLVFRPEQLDLILSFIEPSLKIIFFPGDNGNLVLHISKLKHLFLAFLFASHEFLGFLI